MFFVNKIIDMSINQCVTIKSEEFNKKEFNEILSVNELNTLDICFFGMNRVFLF